MGKVVGVVWRWWSGLEIGRRGGVLRACWLLGIDGEGRGSGVEVVEWAGKWEERWCS
nr:hypothetical protein [Tanacetum cinerariifolium]